MLKPSAHSISIAAVSASTTLSKQQKAFNRLIKQIEQKRALLAAWEATLPRYQKKYTEEVLPLDSGIEALKIRLIHCFSAAHEKKGITRSERKQLDELIVAMIQGTPDGAIDAELKAIYNRHARSDFDADVADNKAFMKSMVGDMMGVDLADDLDFDTPDEFMRHVAEKFAEQQEDAFQQQEQRQAKRKKSAKQIAREEAEAAAEQDVSQSLRGVYRKLASALHPDREPDPVERKRKTALMQKANKAYDSRNLLQLLELQLELEHIDPAALARMSEDKLKHYNLILKDQSRELDMELIHVENEFMLRFKVEVEPDQVPAALLRGLEIEIIEKTHARHDMERDIESFADIAALKAFLRTVKRARRGQFAGSDECPF
jgi:hypothetical protein